MGAKMVTKMYPNCFLSRSLIQFHVIFVIISLVFTYYFYDDLKYWILIFSALFICLFHLPPIIYFTFTYYTHSKDYIFEVTSEKINVTYKGSSKTIHNDDIDKIIIHISAGNPRFSYPMSPIDFYHFAQIILKDGREVLMTSLFAENVGAVLEGLDGVTIERKNKIAFLWWRDKYKPLFSDQVN